MRPISTNDFKNGSKFTGECYGTRVTIELDHSDLSIDELFDAFKGIALGLGFSESGWNDYIRETGYDLQLDAEESEINLSHSNEHWNDEDATFEWDSDYFTMTRKDANVFAESILNPQPPNEALKEAAQKFNDELKGDGNE